MANTAADGIKMANTITHGDVQGGTLEGFKFDLDICKQAFDYYDTVRLRSSTWWRPQSLGHTLLRVAKSRLLCECLSEQIRHPTHASCKL